MHIQQMISMVQGLGTPLAQRVTHTPECNSLIFIFSLSLSLSNKSSKCKHTTNANYSQTNKHTQATFADNILRWARGTQK